MRYAIDSERQALVATGVEPTSAMVWEEVNGKRKPSETEQERDPDTGMKQFHVEVMYRQSAFGRENTVTAMVKCGAVDMPEVAPFAPVQFRGLSVEVRTNKSGGVQEFWTAEEFVPSKPAGSTGTSAASASKSASSKSEAA